MYSMNEDEKRYIYGECPRCGNINRFLYDRELDVMICMCCGGFIHGEPEKRIVWKLALSDFLTYKVFKKDPEFSILGHVLLYYNRDQEKVNVPNGVRKIGKIAFNYQSDVKEIILPKSIRCASRK